MSQSEIREHIRKTDHLEDEAGPQGSDQPSNTRSGRPNPDGSEDERDTVHRSGYGGDGGEPRTNSGEEKSTGS